MIFDQIPEHERAVFLHEAKMEGERLASKLATIPHIERIQGDIDEFVKRRACFEGVSIEPSLFAPAFVALFVTPPLARASGIAVALRFEASIYRRDLAGAKLQGNESLFPAEAVFLQAQAEAANQWMEAGILFGDEEFVLALIEDPSSASVRKAMFSMFRQPDVDPGAGGGSDG